MKGFLTMERQYKCIDVEEFLLKKKALVIARTGEGVSWKEYTKDKLFCGSNLKAQEVEPIGKCFVSQT